MSQSFKLFFSPAAIGPLIAVVAAGCAPKITGPGLPISPSSFSGTSASPADSAQVLLGKDFWDDTGTKVSGTMPLGANVTGANAQLGFAIPQGYYDGVKTATAADTNLVATNIKSGVSLFGVTGSVMAAYSACTDNALNAGQCSTSASRYVASALGSVVSGSNGSLSKTIPLGFYDGTTSCTMSDTGLVAGNIISGVSIFGVAGSITNNGNLNAANTWPGAGYYGATPTGAPTAGQVCNGTSVLGTAGSATCGGVILASNQHRDLATTQVSQSTETVTNAATLYTNADPGYRVIPKISKDDDGYTGGSVTMVARTNWDTSCDSTTGAAGGSANSVCKCGLSGTITARIADCAAHGTIGTNATVGWRNQRKCGPGCLEACDADGGRHFLDGPRSVAGSANPAPLEFKGLDGPYLVQSFGKQ